MDKKKILSQLAQRPVKAHDIHFASDTTFEKDAFLHQIPRKEMMTEVFSTWKTGGIFFYFARVLNDCNYIIKVHEWLQTPISIKLTVLRPTTTLASILQPKTTSQLSFDSLQSLAKQMLMGLHQLQEKNVLHRNIHPQSIWIIGDDLVQISGLQHCSWNGPLNNTIPRKFPPHSEYDNLFLQQERYKVEDKDGFHLLSYGCSVDNFALALLLYELFIGDSVYNLKPTDEDRTRCKKLQSMLLPDMELQTQYVEPCIQRAKQRFPSLDPTQLTKLSQWIQGILYTIRGNTGQWPKYSLSKLIHHLQFSSDTPKTNTSIPSCLRNFQFNPNRAEVVPPPMDKKMKASKVEPKLTPPIPHHITLPIRACLDAYQLTTNIYDTYRVIDLVNAFVKESSSLTQEQKEESLVLASRLLSDSDQMDPLPSFPRQFHLLQQMLQIGSKIPFLFQPHTLVDLVFILPSKKTPLLSHQLLSLLLVVVSWISFPIIHNVYSIGATLLDFYREITYESIVLCDTKIQITQDTFDFLQEHFSALVRNPDLSKWLYQLFPQEWIRFSGYFIPHDVHRRSALLSKWSGQMNPFLQIEGAF